MTLVIIDFGDFSITTVKLGTNYAISVNPIENPSIQQIKVVSKILGENFITSKKVLEKGGTVFEGKTVDVKSIVKTLKDIHIKCVISPEFPY